MTAGIKVQFEAVREVAAASITASYTAIGSATAHPIRLICITNSTNAEVYISIDGSTNHLRLAVNSFKLLDLTANEVNTGGLYIADNTTFYVKRVSGAPSTGSVWIETLYAFGDN